MHFVLLGLGRSILTLEVLIGFSELVLEHFDFGLLVKLAICTLITVLSLFFEEFYLVAQFGELVFTIEQLRFKLLDLVDIVITGLGVKSVRRSLVGQ